MKLLLAVDLSAFSAPPINAVATRPWPSGSAVRIVTIVAPYPVGAEAPSMAVAEAEEALWKEAESMLRSVREEVERSGLPVETCVRRGKAGSKIVEEAKEWGADLILMGSHGRTGIRRVLMGSVAQYVVSHAPCSVEVVRAS